MGQTKFVVNVIDVSLNFLNSKSRPKFITCACSSGFSQNVCSKCRLNNGKSHSNNGKGEIVSFVIDAYGNSNFNSQIEK